jgi:hypothetical protein
MLNRIVAVGTLFGIVFKDMFIWMWNNPDKIW